jgi:NDP-sugar pyrophosphorylase family protein
MALIITHHLGRNGSVTIKPMKAILPVAGNGTRMYPLGVNTPKCLIPILNKPQLIWSLENMQQAGITEVVLVISAGKFGQQIRNFATNLQLQFTNLKLNIAVQEQQLGTAHVVQMARDFFSPGEEFFFC